MLHEVVEAVPTDSGATTIALYSMLSAIVVALVGVLGQVVIARLTKHDDDDPRPGGRAARRAARTSHQHEAWERWFLLNGIDPRKIRTGYETPQEVRRASP